MKVLRRPPTGRVAVFVDGFNVYHSLDRRDLRKYLWLNYRALGRELLRGLDGVTLRDVFYFTAYTRNPDKQSRHQVLVTALKNAYVTPVFGQFKLRDHTCPKCRRGYKKPEEKMTDVNIVAKCLEWAIRDEYDTALVVTADTDVMALFWTMRTCFPEKPVGVAFPFGRSSDTIRRAADFVCQVKRGHLARSQFPDVYELRNGKTVHRPTTWNWPLPDGADSTHRRPSR